MSNVVFKVSETIMQEIKENYNYYHVDQQPAGSVFVAKKPGCTITGYRSGKVMFQGKNAEEEADKWKSRAQLEPEKQTKAPAHKWSPPQHIAEQSIIGSDEVGTGDYFGPMTVAAAFVRKDQYPLLTELGVKDSKHLSDEKISSIAKDIISIIPHSVLVLRNKKYNDLQQRGMNQGKMKALLHNRALLNTIEKLSNKPYNGILIDQFVDPSVYFRYISSEKKQLTSVYFATQAEQLHLSVAAASIISRYAFLRELDQLSEQFGIKFPKGAGKQVDEVAAVLIEKEGETALEHCAKLHFTNTIKAKQLVELRSNR